MSRAIFSLTFSIFATLVCSAEILSADPPTKSSWQSAAVVQLEGAKVTVSRPILVARSARRLWFPVITRFDDGKLMAIMSAEADTAKAPPGKQVSWSSDGGLTSSPPKPAAALRGGGPVHLPAGDMLILPFGLSAHADGTLFGPSVVVSSANQQIRELGGGVSIGIWPRPMLKRAEGERASFNFNRHVVQTADGGYLGTLYGKFKDTDRLALIAAKSHDGLHWNVRGVIADDSSALKGKEGPNEAALARLKDGRITCIFRMAFSDTPYGQSFSGDHGKTWSEPVAMDDVFAVCPCIAELADNALLLTGGRTGIYAWLNLDGLAKNWQKIDLQANHNACEPGYQIVAGHTTAYTHTTVVDQNSVLCIYDRIPFGWGTIPKTSNDTNSTWVVRLTVTASSQLK